MRCTSCGLPLSPTRTPANCPRCGTPLSSGQKSQSSLEVNDSANGGLAPIAASTSNGFGGEASFHMASSSIELQSRSQPDQMWMPEPRSAWSGSPDPRYGSGVSHQLSMPSGRAQPRKPADPKIGFMVAGLCVLLG